MSSSNEPNLVARERRRRVGFSRAMGALVTGGLFLGSLISGPQAAAFDQPKVLSPGQIVYSFHANVPSSVRSIALRGDQAWQAQGLNAHIDLVPGSSSNQVRLEYIDGRGGIIGKASFGCPANYSAGCLLAVDPSEAWYVGTGTPPRDRLDMWGLFSHEFGHWVGANHSTDLPSTHPYIPTMYPRMSYGSH